MIRIKNIFQREEQPRLYTMEEIEKAEKKKEEIAKLYDITLSSVVWMGGNNYIFIKDEKEIKITF